MLHPHDIDRLLPEIENWVEIQEQGILHSGLMLDDDQQIDAFLIGVKNPASVRLMKVNEIPLPANDMLVAGASQLGLLTKNTCGITFRYGIYIIASYWNNRSLLIHELTHTMQYERLGGIHPFLKQYLHECLTYGYINSPLEIEAREMEMRIE